MENPDDVENHDAGRPVLSAQLAQQMMKGQ
jgi:hypothetical protein